MATTPHCKTAINWLKANGHSLGMLTGQERQALEAVAHCWALCAVADEEGHQASLVAIRALLAALQPKCWVLARELIAQSMDWDDRERLWPLVSSVQFP
jgi:hypothetical protein